MLKIFRKVMKLSCNQINFQYIYQKLKIVAPELSSSSDYQKLLQMKPQHFISIKKVTHLANMTFTRQISHVKQIFLLYTDPCIDHRSKNLYSSMSLLILNIIVIFFLLNSSFIFNLNTVGNIFRFTFLLTFVMLKSNLYLTFNRGAKFKVNEHDMHTGCKRSIKIILNIQKI